MKDLRLIKTFTKSIVRDLLKSNLSTYAKLVIRKEPTKSSFSSSILGSHSPVVSNPASGFSLPPGFKSEYWIKILPIEKHGMRLSSYQQYINSGSSRFAPYDFWAIVNKNDIRVDQFGANKTYFDFCEYCEIQGCKYKTKGQFLDESDEIFHIFLIRTEE